MKIKGFLSLVVLAMAFTSCNNGGGSSGGGGGHTHHYQYNYNEEQHWQECVECHDVIDRENHVVEHWEEIYPATEHSSGLYEGYCVVCDFLCHKETDPLPHTHNHNGGMGYNDEQHFYYCSDDGEAVDFENHDFSPWEEIYPATYTSEGQEERYCYVCGYHQYKTTPPIPHTHDYEAKFDEWGHWQECSICHDTIEYQSHDLYVDSETTPESIFDSNVKTYKCHGCNYSKKEKGDPVVSVYYDEDLNGYVIDGLNDHDVKKVEIPDYYNDKPIVKIGNNAFNYCSNLIEVTLPATLRIIGDAAFNGCDNLIKVNIPTPNEIQSIGNNAFRGCYRLAYFKSSLLTDLREIGNQAFAYSGIVDFTLPSSLESISNEAFNSSRIFVLYNYSKISYSFDSYNFPDTYVSNNPGLGGHTHVFYVDGFIFGVHNKLVKLIGTYLTDESKTMTLPTVNRLTDSSGRVGYDVTYYHIRKYAIYAKGVEEFIMSDQVIRVESEYIRYYENIKLAVISRNLYYETTVSGNGYTEYHSPFADVFINSITTGFEIASDHFRYVYENHAIYSKDKTRLILVEPSVTEFTIPSTVKTIENGAFHFSKIEEITIPDGCLVKDYVFEYCYDLVKVNNLHNFSQNLFYCCEKLTTINYASDFNPETEYSPFGDYKYNGLIEENGLYYLEIFDNPHYMLVSTDYEVGSDGILTIHPDTQYVVKDALCHASYEIAEVHAPFAGNSIEKGRIIDQLPDRNIIRFVYNNNAVTKIGNRSFENCYSLEEIIFPEYLEEIGYSAIPAVVSNYAEEGLILPETVKYIGEENILAVKYIPSGLEYVGRNGLYTAKITKDYFQIEDNIVYYKSAANPHHLAYKLYDTSDKPNDLVFNNECQIIMGSMFSGTFNSVTLPENLLTIIETLGGLTIKNDYSYGGFKYIGSTSNPYMFAYYSDPNYTLSLELHPDCQIFNGHAFFSSDYTPYLNITDNVIQIIGNFTYAYSMIRFGNSVKYFRENITYSRAVINDSEISDEYLLSVVTPYATLYESVSENPYHLVEGVMYYRDMPARTNCLDYETAMKLYGDSHIPNTENFYWDGTIEEWLSYVEHIGYYATYHEIVNFYYKANNEYVLLKDLVLPEGTKYIPDYAFNGIRSIESVTCNSDLMKIGERAFYECYRLKELHLNEGLLHLGGYAIKDTGIKRLIIPSTVVQIDYSFFDGTANLKTVLISGQSYFKSYILGSLADRFTCFINMSVNATVKRDELDQDFYYDVNKSDIVVGSDKTYSASLYISGVEYYNLLLIDDESDEVYVNYYKVRAIYGGFLSGNFSTLHLTDNIKYIGASAFMHCDNLTTIYFDGTTDEWNEVVDNREWAAGSQVTTVICSNSTITLD